MFSKVNKFMYEYYSHSFKDYLKILKSSSLLLIQIYVIYTNLLNKLTWYLNLATAKLARLRI